MQYKEIEVSLGLTVSPRQYESIRADARVLLEVASGDDYTEAFVSARSLPTGLLHLGLEEGGELASLA